MNLYQNRRERERLEQELELLKAEKDQCGRKQEYAQEVLQNNYKALINIENFQLDKMQVVRRFQGIMAHQRSVQSMRYVLENNINGQMIQDLHGNVEGKISTLAGLANSFDERIEKLSR